MIHRRDFFAASISGAGCLLLGRIAAGARTLDETWLTYAIDVELFWRNLPFLDRLKKVAEAGFASYEFGPFKAKDLPAIDKVSRDLNLTPVLFSAYRGITDPKRKEPFLESIDDAIEAADLLGVKKLSVAAGGVIKGMEREAMLDAVVDALKDAAEKAKEQEITILLEPSRAPVGHPAHLVVNPKDAAELVDAVGAPNLKLLFDVDQPQISSGNLSDNIKNYFSKIGHFQVACPPGRPPPAPGEMNPDSLLKLIHDLGYRDPIGVGVRAKGDPLEALKKLREADAAAKALP